MADKIQLDAATGANVYAVIRNSAGQAYRADTAVFENYVTANLTLTKYAIALAEQGTASGLYSVSFPVVAAGVYSVVAKYRASTNPAESDLSAGTGDVQWDGTAIVPLAAVKIVTDHLATALELNSGNYRFTVAALFNAPAGGGGGGSTAAAIWAYLIDGLAASAHIGWISAMACGAKTYADNGDGTWTVTVGPAVPTGTAGFVGVASQSTLNRTITSRTAATPG